MTVERRFWAKVEVPNSPSSCWEWRGARSDKGYGNITIAHGGTQLVHRFAYQLLVGVIPGGMTVDHLCRNRACVNPLHFDIVSPQENHRRGNGGSRTHCAKGHPFNAENTTFLSRGDRSCRACRRIRDSARKRPVQLTLGDWS